MQVKQRLKINAAISVAAAAAIILVFSLALYRLNTANNLAKISGDIILNAFERVTLRNDYLQNGNERAKTQWLARHEAIGKILEAASKTFQDPEDKKNLDELSKNHEQILKIFSTIVKSREKNKSTSDDAVISQEIEDRLISQLNIKVYETVLHGRELLASSRKARAAAIRQAGGWTASVLILLVVAVIINSRTMSWAITDRVKKLRDGALVIGGGDLDHRIDIKGDDEFTELAVAFNAMTAKLKTSTERLKTSYSDLNNEVEERKRAEETLAKAYDELELRIQERTKDLKDAEESLREMNETLEQRVAERSAEVQAANASLRDSRRATLNLMQDALVARKKAEEANAELLLEIAERKQRVEELNAANAELTRFNNAAVDRELRMIALKKEINELYKQSGLPPRYPLDFEKETK